MFVPSQHLGRSLNAPGTTRRAAARNNENAGVHLPAKTPVRAPLGGGGPLKPGLGTVGRPLGLKTIERNVLAPKSEHPPLDDIGPKRLFKNANPSNKPSTSHAQQKAMKTPAPSRQGLSLRTPAPQRMPEPSPLPLPSAQRTRRRSRSSLSSHAHSSPDHSFATPAPVHRWEDEVSLDSILEAADVAEEAFNGGEGSDNELEYAPPTAKDMPFIPIWADDIPDPIETMNTIATMRPLFFHNPPSPPSAIREVSFPSVTLCPEDELEHPLLRRSKPRPKPLTACVSKVRQGGTTGFPSTSRPGVSGTRPTTVVPSRSAPHVVRPASITGAKSSTKPGVPRLGVRPATSAAATRPMSTSRTTGAATVSTARTTAAGVGGTARVGTLLGPIRGAAPPAKPTVKGPELTVAAPDLNFELDLDLDILGPDPRLEKAVEYRVDSESLAAEADENEPGAAGDAMTTVVNAHDASPAAEFSSRGIDMAPLLLAELTAVRPVEPQDSQPEPSLTPSCNPKVTLTVPDTSAEITQDLNASYIYHVTDFAPEPIPEVEARDRLAAPAEFQDVDGEPLPADSADCAHTVSSPPRWEDSLDSFDGEAYELQELLPRPHGTTTTLVPAWEDGSSAGLATNATGAASAKAANSAGNDSFTAEGSVVSADESWAPEDLSFTDDILAAAMAKCNMGRGLGDNAEGSGNLSRL